MTTDYRITYSSYDTKHVKRASGEFPARAVNMLDTPHTRARVLSQTETYVRRTGRHAAGGPLVLGIEVMT